MRNMMSSSTPPTLRNAKTSSPLTARKHPNRFTTALLLLVMTLKLCLMVMEDTDMASVRLRRMLRQRLSLDMATQVDLNAKTRRTGSVTRSQSRMSARFLVQSAKPLLTPPTLRSVRKHSPPSAIQPTHRFTTALLLSVMTLKSLLMVMEDMVDMDTKSVKLRMSRKQRLRLSLDMVTPVDPSAMLRRTDSATRSQYRTPTRSPDKYVFQSQGRSATLLRSRFPDKSAITLVMLWNMGLIMVMDTDTGVKSSNIVTIATIFCT